MLRNPRNAALKSRQNHQNRPGPRVARQGTVMDLCVATHRAVLKALQAFEDGELVLAVHGVVTVDTRTGILRFAGGVCFAAPLAEWIGAQLVGWLEELGHLSGVGAWWRPGLRAVLRRPDGHFALVAPARDLSIDGVPAESGVATHSPRFLVAHGEAAPCSPALSPAPRASQPPPAPVRAVSPPAARRAIPRPPDSGVDLTLRARGGCPRPPDSGVDRTLRARGTWRTTAVEPWTLGHGQPAINRPERAAR